MSKIGYKSDRDIRIVLDTMGCTRNDEGEQIIDDDRVSNPELRAFLERAVRLFQDRSVPQAAFFEEDIINMVKGLVGTCSDNQILKKSELERYEDIFVRLCGFAPEGTRTSPEGNRTTVVAGSCRLIEVR